jgi:uncharacterized protein YecT (DUF1311 family)
LKRIVSFFLIAYWSSNLFASGRITTGPDNEPPNPIDVEFEKCMKAQSTTLDWGNCVISANVAWKQVLDKKYLHLLDHLDPKRKSLLIASQKAWELSIETDFEFLNSYSDLRVRIGSSGYVTMTQTRMHKVRDRALDLTDYDEVFVERVK